MLVVSNVLVVDVEDLDVEAMLVAGDVVVVVEVEVVVGLRVVVVDVEVVDVVVVLVVVNGSLQSEYSASKHDLTRESNVISASHFSITNLSVLKSHM